MNNKGLLASIAFLTCLVVSAILMRPTKFGDLASGSASELAREHVGGGVRKIHLAEGRIVTVVWTISQFPFTNVLW